MNRLAMKWKKRQTVPYTANGQTFKVRVVNDGDVWTAKVIGPMGNEKSNFTARNPDDVYRHATQAIRLVCLRRKVLSEPQYWHKGRIGQKYEGPSGCPIFLMWEDHLRLIKEDRKGITEHEIRLIKRAFYQAAFDIVHELIHFAHDPEEVMKTEAVWLHEVGKNLGESLDWSDKFGQVESDGNPVTN